MCHAVEPVSKHVSRYHGSCFPNQNKKSGLKSVFRIVLMEQAAANAPDHRAMLANQGRKSRFVSAIYKASQQLSIGWPRFVFQEHGGAQMLNEVAELACRHLTLLNQAFDPYVYYPK